MAIKRKVSKTEYDALSDANKVLYVENKSRAGEYILDIDGDADNELKTALEAIKAEKRELAAKLKALEDAAEVEAEKKNKGSGDIAALEASYKAKLDKLTAETQAALDAKNSYIRNQLVDNVAMSIASELSKSPKVLLPHIKARITADLDGDAPSTKVLGADGKLSALTLDDLKKEFKSNPDFAGVIIGNKASGGDTGSVGGNVGRALAPDGKPINLALASNDVLRAHIDAQVKASG